nr:glycosyltransferase 87 family protein [Kibdelosporangium sp. MJ126-NF4]CEL17946.1 Probable conserved integral membrane protein [Kibdelosporangium sp. MJ126-NF4]CTQ90826.1 Probable conserved integral membrane protein [Kibdelosporangium sp. MJ126-NF4]
MRVSLLAGIIAAGVWCALMAHTYRLDLEVYRIGVQAWLDGGDLYGRLPDTSIGLNLPFIYPPVAAALMVPLTVIPFPVATIILTALTIVLVSVTLAITLKSVGLSPRWVALLPAAILLEPVRTTMAYGQINVILMALVVADCLIENPRWRRGVLVGIAAAIKLTPLAFLLFFLIRRDRRAAVTTITSFLGATAVGFVVSWSSSVTFWTDAIFHTEDKVGVGYIANQSILGVLLRLDVGKALWLVLVAVVLAAAVWAMRTATAPMAFGITALAMLLVSPISWSHHWVWCVPVLVIFAAQGQKVLAAVGAVLFAVGPHWWFEQVTTPTLAQQVIVDLYFLFAVAAVAVLAYQAKRGRTVDSLEPTPAGQLTVVQGA